MGILSVAVGLEDAITPVCAKPYNNQMPSTAIYYEVIMQLSATNLSFLGFRQVSASPVS